MKTPKKIETGFILLALLCCAVFFSCKQKSQTEIRGTYKTIRISLSQAQVSTHYSASVRGKQNVEIRPQVSGLITGICVEEGAVVQKGQSLFIIDQVPYKAALETAAANVISARSKVATAQMTVDSKRELYQEQVISVFDLQSAQNELDEATATLAQARAEELNARNNFSYTVIKSPLDGVASMIPYKVGTLVSASISEPLVTVSSQDEMYAYFSMTESQILTLTQEQGTLSDVIRDMPSVRLVLSNGTPYEVEGKIDAISGTVDQQTGAIPVRAVFDNPGHLLRNGGTATIIISYEKQDCILIPKSATFEIQDRVYVYKVVDGKATSAEIIPFKIDNGTAYIVESGLHTGDIIIAEGAGLLREGTPVQMDEKNN